MAERWTEQRSDPRQRVKRSTFRLHQSRYREGEVELAVKGSEKEESIHLWRDTKEHINMLMYVQ